MGREIKRVPVDFDWPIEQTWAGYVSPYTSVKCRSCDGRGESKEYRELCDDWYGWDKPIYEGSCYKLTQEEANLLADRDRLIGLSTILEDHKWKRRLNEDGSNYYPSAEEVNEWAKKGLGHDSINQWIVCKHRAEKSGISIDCPVCNGEGHFWQSEEIRKAAEEWEEIPPPEGEGWQVWETVGEGSPVTPVFATAEELIEYLVEYGDTWCQKRPNEEPPSRKAASMFVYGSGWVPSGMSNGKEFKSGISIAEFEGNEK